MEGPSGIFNYLTIIDTTRKELTLLEKEDFNNMFEELNKDFARMNEIKDRLNEIGTYKPMMIHDEVEIEFAEEHQAEAKELIKELNAFAGR